MRNEKGTPKTSAFFQWAQQNFGLWTLICTPGHEHMNPLNLVDIIEKLAEANLDELIFVMLAVHRSEPFIAHFYRTMLFDLLAEHWEDNREDLINKLIHHLE